MLSLVSTKFSLTGIGIILTLIQWVILLKVNLLILHPKLWADVDRAQEYQVQDKHDLPQ